MKALSRACLGTARALAALFSLVAAAHAQTPSPPLPPVPLKDVITIALEHNRQIQGARLSLQGSQLAFRSTRASYFGASLTADGTQLRDIRFDNTTSVQSLGSRLALSGQLLSGAVVSFDTGSTFSASGAAAGNRAAQDYTLGVSQPFLRGFGHTVASAPLVQGRNSVLASEERLAQTIMDTIVRVEAAYWNLLLQAEGVTIQTAALARSRQLKATTESLIAAGRVPRNELIRSEADIASQEVGLASAEQAVHQAENQLRQTLGVDLPGRLVAVAPDTITSQPADLKASLDLAFLNRPDWKAASLDLENSALSVRVAENARLYALDVAASYAGQAGGPTLASALSGLSNQRSSTLALKLDVPLNNTQGVVNALSASVSHQQVQLQIAEERQQIEIEVDDAVSRVNLQIQQLDLTRRARQLAEQSLQAELEKLRVGRSTNFNVVQLQNDVNAAFNNELQARIGYLLARSGLDRATGTTLKQWNVTVH